VHPDVADLLQEVYLQLLIAGDQRSGAIQSVISYACTAARNKAYDWIRHQRFVAATCPTVDIDDVDVPAESALPDELLIAEQQLQLLYRAIDSLPARCREVFLLRKIHGMSHREIASSLHISVNTIEQHINRASQLLGVALKRYGTGHTLVYAPGKRATPLEARKAG